MNTASRLTAFGAALVVLAGGGYLVGSATAGPGPTQPSPSATPSAGHGGHSEAGMSQTTPTLAPDGHAHGHGADSEPAQLPGLAASNGGFTFVPVQATLPAGGPTDFAFRITRPDGAVVTDFDITHEKRMHLIVVRRDTTGFQHVHPQMDPDGTWRVPLALPTGGSYRAFADFSPSRAPATTLGVDLAVPGEFRPTEHPASSSSQVDGYEITLAGELTPGSGSSLTLTVRKDGRPVTDLQPYLGAYGHLVSLRVGDLAFLHVHPEGTPGDGRTAAGPDIRYQVEVPTPGTYRLFLDFQHQGVVRTAEFTVTAVSTSERSPR